MKILNMFFHSLLLPSRLKFHLARFSYFTSEWFDNWVTRLLQLWNSSTLVSRLTNIKQNQTLDFVDTFDISWQVPDWFKVLARYVHRLINNLHRLLSTSQVTTNLSAELINSLIKLELLQRDGTDRMKKEFAN